MEPDEREQKPEKEPSRFEGLSDEEIMAQVEEEEQARRPPRQGPADAGPSAPPLPPEPVTTGTVIVYGSSAMQGDQIVVSGVAFGSKEFYGTIAERMVGGRRRLAVVFPKVPEGVYDVHHPMRYAQVSVLAGDEALVDWSG